MKRYHLLLLAFVTWAMASCKSAPEREWVSVSVDEGVSVWFPAQPRQTESTDSSAYGPYPKQEYAYLPPEGDDENLVYQLSATTMPVSYTYHATPPQTYDSFVGQEVALLGGRLVSQKTITQSGVTGREALIDFRGGAYRVKCRLFIRGRTIYNIGVATKKESLFNVAINKFLDSLAFLP